MPARIVKAKTTKQQLKLADDALKARLYVSGWCLSGELRYIRDGGEGYEIAVAYEDGMAVGVAIDTPENNTQVFVRKAKRHNGYGRRLVKKVKREGSYGICGADGEGKIFTKNGIIFH